MKPKHASYSGLNMYDQCPHHYRIERVDKRKAPDSKPLRVGSAVHAAIAEYIRHLQGDNLQTDVTWVGPALHNAFVSMEEEGRNLSREEWDEVTTIFETFIHSHMFEPSQIAEFEKKEEIHLDGLTFWAVIDLLEVVDGGVRVRDWKTNWNVTSQAEVDRDFQLRCYAWAVHKLYGYNEVRCDLEFVRHGAVRSTLIGLDEIILTEARIIAAVEQIEAEKDWPATPGSHCTYCPWADECMAITNEIVDDPEKLAAEILVLEKQVRDRKDKLAVWCTENGPVTVGGEIFGHLPSKDGGWIVTDLDKYFTVLAEYNLPAWDYFNADSAKLKSIRTAKKWVHVLADIESLLEREIKTTFTHRKAEG